MRRHLLTSRLITTFGLGHLRPASGTWGSLPPVLWAASLVLLKGLTHLHTPIEWVYHVTLWGTFLVFSWAVIAGGDRAEAVFGPDPHEVVADETAGQCLPLLFIPPAFMVGPWWMAGLGIALAFVLFRVADILKPWPCNSLQRVPGGWGVLLDDLVAGGYSVGGLWVVALLI